MAVAPGLECTPDDGRREKGGMGWTCPARKCWPCSPYISGRGLNAKKRTVAASGEMLEDQGFQC